VRVVSGAEGLVQRGGRRVAVPGALGLADGQPGLLLIRPELVEPVGRPTPRVTAISTMTGKVEVQTFLGATTRLLMRESHMSEADAPATRLLAVDVPSSSAARWPAGSELEVRIPIARAVSSPTVRYPAPPAANLLPCRSFRIWASDRRASVPKRPNRHHIEGAP